MKKLFRMLGVTLLEVMLVLAIAAMIIVMSIRYYQSATAAQNANTVLSLIQGIVSSADSLASATGSYSGGSVNTATITNLMPGNSMTTPWGASVSISATDATGYTVEISSTPANVCPLVAQRLKANTHYTNIATCGTTAAVLSFKYISNP